MADRTLNIGAYTQRFNMRLGVFKRGVLIKLFSAIIKDTPVDTGRLRANWQIKFGSSPAPTALDVVDPSGAATIGRITQEVMSKVTDEDGEVELVNPLPYTNRVEYEGWSHTKAPQGMVRKNVVRIVRLLEEQLRSGQRQ